MKLSDFSKFSARFHRNGIGGAPFHVCEFTWRDGNVRRQMQAVVFNLSWHVAVLEPANPRMRWRGDEFDCFLRQLIDKHESPEYYAR